MYREATRSLWLIKSLWKQQVSLHLVQISLNIKKSRAAGGACHTILDGSNMVRSARGLRVTCPNASKLVWLVFYG